MTEKRISRNTNAYRPPSPSLPPEMAEQVQGVMREEERTMSELIREIL